MTVPPTETPVLALSSLRARRSNGWSVGIEELSLRASEVAALVGPSGCGKTSLLLGWTGLLSELDVSGDRLVDGVPCPDADSDPWREMLAGPVTLVLQDPKATLDPLQKVQTQIATVTGAARDDCLAALRALGLSDAERIAGAWPHQLSGGQAQKVLLAIALLRAPRLLLLDEPTGSLDGASIDDLVAGLDLLRERHQTAVLLATHDASLVAALAARVFQFEDGWFRESIGGDNGWPAAERAEPGEEVVLTATGLCKAYGGTTVLSNCDLSLCRSEVVAVVGPSGCGKTTLARILTGHLEADAGNVVGGAGSQLLFQDAYASLTPHRTIGKLIQETRTPLFDVAAETAAVGLPADRLACYPGELSGGERRRAALLRALSVEPHVLVLDEPTASLDHGTAVSVMRMLMEISVLRGLACVLITHDEAMADAVAHRILRFRKGRLS